jgi:lysophospholipase L1-like esterase
MKPFATTRFLTLAAFLIATGPALLSGQVADPDATRFADAMETFAEYDAKNSFPADATLFVGSSSIVYWDTAERFPGLTLINRGFGGSQMSDALHYVQETVLKYSPRTVVLYEGDNDTSAGKRSQQILGDYQEFVEIVLAAQPSTRIIILSIKPSLARWDVWPDMQEANDAIEAYAHGDARVDFVDVGTAMLGADGLPIPELFVSDGLHMTSAGYDVWDEILMEALMPGQHMEGMPMHGQGGGGH